MSSDGGSDHCQFGSSNDDVKIIKKKPRFNQGNITCEMKFEDNSPKPDFSERAKRR